MPKKRPRPCRIKKEIWAREELDSTGIENGVAVPHARCAAVKRPGLAAMTVPAGVDCGAEDGEPSNLFFMIAARRGAARSIWRSWHA